MTSKNMEQEQLGAVAVRAPTSLTASTMKLPVPRSLIASAVRIRADDSLWNTYRFTDETWQAECWRFFHITPELHYAADLIGSACSRVRIYVGGLDELGRPTGEIDDDDQIMAVSDTLFGGPSAKSEALKAIGANLTVAGECYIIGRARRDTEADKWFIASTTELRRRVGQIVIDFGYGPEKLLAGSDLVIRLWTPDPQRMRFSDSPTRACMNVLLELEELEKYEFSQIDSRLSGAGAYFIPAEMSNGPDNGSDAPQSATDVFNLMGEAARASKTQRGSAASVVPMFIEVPGEFLKDMMERPVKFESELSDKLQGLKDSAIRRLANGLNMPPEVLLGMGDANHFSAWHIEESFVKIQIEPMMNRICDGLTQAYLKPLLKAMGKDPDRYELCYDTAPLTVRPNRLQDTLNLYERGIVSALAVLEAGNYNPATAAPSEEEDTRRFVRALMERDPTLIAVPQLVEAAGLDIEMPAPAAIEGVPGDPNAPGPPPPPRPDVNTNRQTPTSGPPTGGAGGATGGGGTPILASGAISYAPDAVLAASNVVVRRALELVGGKLLTRENRGRFPNTPKWELHTKLKMDAKDAEITIGSALDSVEQDFAAIDVSTVRVRRALFHYCTGLVQYSRAHTLEEMRTHLGYMQVKV